MTEREKYNSAFETALNEFAKRLQNYISTDTGEWTIKGFIDVYKSIYTLSSDTKIVSKTLEIHILPEILRFAEKVGYEIIPTAHQNGYPDLTLQKEKRLDEYRDNASNYQWW